jgi:hypothetical protein
VSCKGDGKYVIADIYVSGRRHSANFWDLATGKPVSVPPDYLVSGKKPVSPDGRYRLVVEGNQVRRTPVRLKQPSIVDQLAKLAPALDWHKEQAAVCENRNDWFAASFHLGRLLKDAPWDASLHARSARALENLGKTTLAREQLLHVLSLRSWPVPLANAVPREKKEPRLAPFRRSRPAATHT